MSAYLLLIYWLFCITATHLPVPPSAEPFLIWDKAMHAGMYGVLAVLLGWWLWDKGYAVCTAFWVGLGVLALYGMADELTQPYFGRTADVFDWFADLVGSASGLAALSLFRLRHRRRPGQAYLRRDP